jgi:hypothetical protein
MCSGKRSLTAARPAKLLQQQPWQQQQLQQQGITAANAGSVSQQQQQLSHSHLRQCPCNRWVFAQHQHPACRVFVVIIHCNVSGYMVYVFRATSGNHQLDA